MDIFDDDIHDRMKMRKRNFSDVTNWIDTYLCKDESALVQYHLKIIMTEQNVAMVQSTVCGTLKYWAHIRIQGYKLN